MKNSNLFTKKFEIYEVDISGRSDVGLGIVPCIIVQNDIGNKYSSTTIIMPLVQKKLDDGGLYFAMSLKNLGNLYVYVSGIMQISKLRITIGTPVEIIEDAEIKKKIERFYLASTGEKVIVIDGKRKIVEMTDSELDLIYKESENC